MMNRFSFLAAATAACCAASANGVAPDSDAILRSEIFAPKVVAIPPAAAVRDLCRTADGEIRHYGWMKLKDGMRRVFIATRDEGLSWKRFIASNDTDCAMVQSPWSGDWLYFSLWRPGEPRKVSLVRSKSGPGDPEASFTPTGWEGRELRQIFPLKSRKRWIACFSDVRCTKDNCYNTSFAFSDDDGKSWRLVDIPPIPGIPKMNPGDKRPHWFNNGCEPTVAELSDGTLLMAVRTSGETHFSLVSKDGGESWSAARPMEGFWSANTMPYFFRLSDGRLLFIWNNTALLPTCDPKDIPESPATGLDGRWETFFTNRDALHAAISDDDGKTWRGFRELILNECRNAPDFRQLGFSEAQEGDKSVHQTQALELKDGKVLLALGQNSAARRIIIFDPDWLLEKSRTDDFRNGLGNVSTHLFVKSLSGGGWDRKGWSGHCAYNRIPGAVLRREPEDNRAAKWRRESLFVARIPDDRLVSDRQGAVWNFPAGRSGSAETVFRIEGEGFRFSLADRWINPCDEVNPLRTPFSRVIGPKDAEPGKWHTLAAKWDDASGTVTLTCDGKTICEEKMKYRPAHGLSYIHVQSAAEKEDSAGTYFRRFSAKVD